MNGVDDETILREVEKRAPDKRLPCRLALRMAEEMGVGPQRIGEAANRLGVKIVACQLGCFGNKSRSKT